MTLRELKQAKKDLDQIKSHDASHTAYFIEKQIEHAIKARTDLMDFLYKNLCNSFSVLGQHEICLTCEHLNICSYLCSLLKEEF